MTSTLPPTAPPPLGRGPHAVPQSPTFQSDLARFASLLLRKTPGSVDYREVALPPVPQLANMNDPEHAPARAANRGVPVLVDIGTITTPTG